MTTSGRNDPCPCGSGKKYKRCCLHSPRASAAPPTAPALDILALVASAVGDNGLSLTQKGNLPRKLVQEIYAADLLPEVLDPFREYEGPPRSEDDVMYLVEVRQSAMFAGLFDIEGRKLRRTPLFDRIIAQGGHRSLYPILLASRALEWNWAYGDRFADLEIVQQAWLFSLYLIARIPPGESSLASELGAAFVRAFPMAMGEADSRLWETPEEFVSWSWTMRTLYRFAGPFGLVTLDALGNRMGFSGDFRVTPTPLLFDAARFR